MRESIYVVFQGSIIILFCCYLWCNANRWISLLLLCVFAAHLKLIVTGVGMSGYLMTEKHSTYTLFAIMIGLGWYLSVIKYGNQEWIENTMQAILVVHVGYITLQHFGIDPIFHDKGNYGFVFPTGLMANQNEASALFAFLAPATFKRKFLLPLVFWGLYCAKSSGGPLALACGLFVYLCLQGHWKYGVAIFAVLFASLFYFDTPLQGLKQRAGNWLVAADMCLENPWGYGVGQYKVIAAYFGMAGSYQTQRFLHNEYLQMVFELGFVVIPLFIGYMVEILRKVTDNRIKAALVIIAVNSLFNFPFHIATTAMVALTWMGLHDRRKNEITNPDLLILPWRMRYRWAL